MKNVLVFDEADVLDTLRGGPIYEGLLGAPGEPEVLRNLIDTGLVERFYEGVGGFMGLAKVRIRQTKAV
jgi:hypothetical protein